MAKPKLLITRSDFPRVPLFDTLEEMFDVFVWPSKEKGRMPEEEFHKQLKDTEALICVPHNFVTKKVLNDYGGKLKVIGTFSVGHDHLDLDELKKKGVNVGSVGDIQSGHMAEFNIGLAIAVGRKFQFRSNFIKSGRWEKESVPIEDCGFSLIKSTAGIVGLGKIGIATAKLLKAFNVTKILYTSRQEKQEGTELRAERVTLEKLCSESDFIFITCALTEETKLLIGKEQINIMKSNAILINTSRGGLLDIDALVTALQEKKIAGAGLDVFHPEPLHATHPLCNLENCSQ